MVIGIDGNEANIENRVGVNVYVFELLWALYENVDEWKEKHSLIVYLKEQPRKDLPKANKFFQYKILPGGGKWIITKLMPDLYLAKQKPDVFFAPSHYIPPFSPMPKACSIMDLGYLEFSGQFRKYDYWQLRLWSAWSIFMSRCVFAISSSTKNDIVRHYPFAQGKVNVTHLAYDSNKFSHTSLTKDVRRLKKKYSIVSRDYVLFLSTLKPSKNIEGLILSWAKIEKQFPDTQLVVAGKKGWLYEKVFDEVKRLGLENRVVFTGFVDEEDKPDLIAGAKVFTLPSFWEGFGLDVLNAFGVGTPVIVSDRGSLPEVAGKAGLVVNPDDTEDIALKIKLVLEMNNDEYGKLVKYGYKQAQKFSWKKTARQTLKALESINAS